MDCDEVYANDWLQPMILQGDDNNTEVPTPSSDFISIVDMSTIICKKFTDDTTQDDAIGFDDQLEIKFSPMMPLTVELMRRKSMYYMGLEQRLFFRLLRIIRRTLLDNTTDSMTEMKIMLTLRKHRLNEEFEALGDMFDIDKTTAQRYYAESKDLVSKLYHSLTDSVSIPIQQVSYDITNSLLNENHRIKEDEQDDQEQEDSSSSEPEIKYKGYVHTDSDIDSEDFKSSDSDSDTDVQSEDFDNSDSEPDGNESKANLAECPICEKNFLNLDNHLRNTHWYPQHLNKTICGIADCLKKFESLQQLRAHQTAIHNGNACVCDVCGQMFTKFLRTKDHILRVHAKVRPFLCHHCGAGYYRECRLRNHVEKAHLQIRNHKCNLCDKKYYLEKELNVHILAVHTNERPFKCQFEGCDKSFGRQKSLHTHEQMHKVKFFCEICSKVFSFGHNLKTHCKNIHGQSFVDYKKFRIEIN